MVSADLEERLRAHVQRLAGDVGERNVWCPGELEAAARYIDCEWAALGCTVVRHSFESLGVPVANLEVVIEGSDTSGAASSESTDIRPGDILVGAHYDTVRGSPGADDNASGVAALLELSRLFLDRPPMRTLRLIAFVNEEKPFDDLGQMGSRRYAEAARALRLPIGLMVALEMLGYYSDAPGSQRYPPLLDRFYPDRADFIALVSNWRCRRQLALAYAAFRSVSTFPVQKLAAPARLVPGVGRSDHSSFWLHGYPALMVTDTAFNRNPNYHAATDVPDTLDYRRMARVVHGIFDMLGRLTHVQEEDRATASGRQRSDSIP